MGVAAMLVIATMNLYHAGNDYGIKSNASLHIEILAQDTIGGGTGTGTGSGDDSGNNSGNNSGDNSGNSGGLKCRETSIDIDSSTPCGYDNKHIYSKGKKYTCYKEEDGTLSICKSGFEWKWTDCYGRDRNEYAQSINCD